MIDEILVLIELYLNDENIEQPIEHQILQKYDEWVDDDACDDGEEVRDDDELDEMGNVLVM